MEYAWPVAGPEAYPRVQRRDRDGMPWPLTEKDLRIASACAASLASFFIKHGGRFAGERFEPVCESWYDQDDLEVRFTAPYQAWPLFEANDPPTEARPVVRAGTRWASHANLVQNDTTRRTTATHVRYLTYFLGNLRLDQITAADVNQMTETMYKNGPISFKLRKDGKPRQRRTSTFTPSAINRILGILKAALHLAEMEDLITKAPPVKFLPRDDSRPVVPPTETEFEAIVEASKKFLEIGPHFPEVIHLAAETGLRESELFNLCWRSVDFSMVDTGGIRVEEQQRTRVVNGKPWKPKHLKFRVVPLGERACPPEDCGGVDGYYHLLEVLADSSNEEYEETLTWVGGKYDADEFDAGKVKFENPKKRWKIAFSDG